MYICLLFYGQYCVKERLIYLLYCFIVFLRATCAISGGEFAQYVHADGDGVERQGHRAAAAQEGRAGQADGARRHRRQGASGDGAETDRVRVGNGRLRPAARPRAGDHAPADRRRDGATGRGSSSEGHTDRNGGPHTTQRMPRYLDSNRVQLGARSITGLVYGACSCYFRGHPQTRAALSTGLRFFNPAPTPYVDQVQG